MLAFLFIFSVTLLEQVNEGAAMQDRKSRFLDPLLHWVDGGDAIIILTALTDCLIHEK